ncbi:hypothetical protein GCM10028805_56530 [Spirosoma harenae]
MNKIILTFLGLTVFFASCNKENTDVDSQQCYTCEIKYTYSGTDAYIPPPVTITRQICSTAEKDTLLKRNGTSDYGPGGFTSKITQAVSCTNP